MRADPVSSAEEARERLELAETLSGSGRSRRGEVRGEVSDEALEAYMLALYLPLTHNQLTDVAERGPLHDPDVLRMLLAQGGLAPEHLVAAVWNCHKRSPGPAERARTVLLRRDDLLTRVSVHLAETLGSHQEGTYTEVALRVAMDGEETFEVFRTLLEDRGRGEVLRTLSLAEVLTIPGAEGLHDDLT